MALKNWKKAKSTKNIIIYNEIGRVRPSNELYLVDNILIGRIDKKVHSKEKNNWAVFTLRGRSKLFKTKSAALKYARAYMRKH